MHAGSSSVSNRESLSRAARNSGRSTRGAAKIKSDRNDDVSLDEEEVAERLHEQSECEQLLQQKAMRKSDADAKLDEYLQIEQDLDQLAEYVFCVCLSCNIQVTWCFLWHLCTH